MEETEGFYFFYIHLFLILSAVIIISYSSIILPKKGILQHMTTNTSSFQLVVFITWFLRFLAFVFNIKKT